MIDPLTFFIACVFGIIVCSFFSHAKRPYIWAVLGLALLIMLAPSSGVFLSFVVIQAVSLSLTLTRFERTNSWRKYAPYLLLLNLLWVDFHQLVLGYIADTIGISFAIIRVFMTTKHLLSNRKLVISDIIPLNFVAAFYLPTIMVGPVFSAVNLKKQERQKDEANSRLYRHLIGGLLLIIVFAQLFQQTALKLSGSTQLYPIKATLLFLALFSSFWGYSLIAEISSKITGHILPKNFDKPWLSVGIRDFWQRWHRSMSQFIMQFIYFPLTLRYVNPKIATIIAFVFMGLWHEVKIGYLIWGVAHGVLMSYWPIAKNPGRIRILLERLLTIFIVINLSYVANYAFK